MFRALSALVVWILVVIILATPLFFAGLVYPSRRFMAWVARVWARLMLAISGVRLTIEGTERLIPGQSYFFVGNHQSALDIPIIIYALRGDVRFLAKESLFHIPIFGWVLARYGFVPIDRSDARKSRLRLQSMVQRVRRSPISFAVFPEGTRSRDGRLLAFRKGALKICIRSGMPVVPFSIDGALYVHHRDDFFRAKPGPVRLVFGNPISSEEGALRSPTELHDHVRTVIAGQLGQIVPPESAVSDEWVTVKSS
jgi:1-acyl-sn-glycerol-3-phosphate acyltransferase